jgi:hypothetical protein
MNMSCITSPPFCQHAVCSGADLLYFTLLYFIYFNFLYFTLLIYSQKSTHMIIMHSLLIVSATGIGGTIFKTHI